MKGRLERVWLHVRCIGRRIKQIGCDVAGIAREFAPQPKPSPLKPMKIDDLHWLDKAIRQPLPGGAPMLTRRFLVIHYTAGASALSSIDYWRKLNNGVCAHFVIDRDGTIFQCRPCSRTAGHAGLSEWDDPKTGIKYRNLNSCSIGIELANGGDEYPTRFSDLPPTTAAHKNRGRLTLWESYPTAQIEACKDLASVLVERYHLDDIVGHDDIAPDRKTDPGPAFPMRALREHCGFHGLPSPKKQ